jgi:hypothetical protein
MRTDFCAFILTHGRPDRVHTYDTLMRVGYTGKVFIVIDDEDKTADEYRKRFGDKVIQFCKAEVAARIDEGDNFNDRRAIIYARNVCWDLARQVGCKYFIQLDDDYMNFYIRHNSRLEYQSGTITQNIDGVISALVDFYAITPVVSVAMSQGGDHFGGGGAQGKGGQGNPSLRRKCMNTFICSVDRPFQFVGRINEDVNTYTSKGRAGALFFTVIQAMVVQLATQSNAGGMTQLYLDGGTYVKTFYSVMYAPSCVKVGQMGDPRSPHYRIHHKINWHNTAPKILREEWRQPRQGEQSSPAQSLTLPALCLPSENSPALPAQSKTLSEPPSTRKGAASKPQP